MTAIDETTVPSCVPGQRRKKAFITRCWEIFLITQQNVSSHARKDKARYLNPCHDHFLTPKKVVVMPKLNHTTHLGEM